MSRFYDDDTMELGEAMSLVKVKPKQLREIKGPKQVRILSDKDLEAIRVRYWCHGAKIRHLAEQYKVSLTTMQDAVKLRNAYADGK